MKTIIVFGSWVLAWSYAFGARTDVQALLELRDARGQFLHASADRSSGGRHEINVEFSSESFTRNGHIAARLSCRGSCYGGKNFIDIDLKLTSASKLKAVYCDHILTNDQSRNSRMRYFRPIVYRFEGSISEGPVVVEVVLAQDDENGQWSAEAYLSKHPGTRATGILSERSETSQVFYLEGKRSRTDLPFGQYVILSEGYLVFVNPVQDRLQEEVRQLRAQVARLQRDAAPSRQTHFEEPQTNSEPLLRRKIDDLMEFHVSVAIPVVMGEVSADAGPDEVLEHLDSEQRERMDFLAADLQVLESLEALPRADIVRLQLYEDYEGKITAMTHAHRAGACQNTARGRRILRDAGFTTDKMDLLVAKSVCGDRVTDARDLLKSLPENLPNIVRQFTVEKRTARSAELVGMGGLLRQRIERVGARWKTVGVPQLNLSCASFALDDRIFSSRR